MEKKSRKFPTTCYTLLNDIEKSDKKLRSVLFLAAKQSLIESPTISASGFYPIDKSTLSTACSVIVTYIIVITQLDLAFDDQ